MKLLHTLLAALLVLPLSLRAQTETLDSIYQFHHPSKVTCTRHGNDVDITLVTGITNTTKQFNFKCSSLRSTPMTASGNPTVSYTFSTPSEVVLKNKADLFRLCIRCNEAEALFARGKEVGVAKRFESDLVGGTHVSFHLGWSSERSDKSYAE